MERLTQALSFSLFRVDDFSASPELNVIKESTSVREILTFSVEVLENTYTVKANHRAQTKADERYCSTLAEVRL